MVKIINGKKYDTGTATKLCTKEFPNMVDYADESYFISLCRKMNGEYFLFHESKEQAYEDDEIILQRYAKIVPLKESDAKYWTEENCSVEEYERIFGVVEE